LVDRKKFRINKQIQAPRILVINEDGKKLGIMVPEEGRRLAHEAGLDLVELSPHENPPVCKIMDFGKYLYKLSKKEKAQKKSGTQLKEMRLSAKISDHDYNYKMKHIREFLESGDKVKVTIFFKGREIVHADRGRRVLERLIEDTSDVGKPEKNVALRSRVMSVVLSPQKK